MAAFNDSGPAQKRIATYGKAVRKRPPDHIAFKTLQDVEKPLGLSGVASVTSSASTESAFNDSPPSPSSSSKSPTKLHVLDFPSSDVDDNASPTPPKKRKLEHITRTIAQTSANDSAHVNHTVLQYASDGVAERNTVARDPTHDASMVRNHDPKRLAKYLKRVQSTIEQPKIPFVQKPDKEFSITFTRAPNIDSQSVARMPPRQQQSILSNQLKENQSSGISSHSPNKQAGQPRILHKMQVMHKKSRASRPTTPNAVDRGDQDDGMASSVSSILTPKGIKMWNDLLGEDDENSESEESDRATEHLPYGQNRHQISSRKRKLPRRRLIDTLVEQSKNSRSMPGLILDLEGATYMESDLGQFSEVVERKEKPSQVANAQTSPKKAQNISKSLGLGQGLQTLGAKITYSRQRSMLAEQDPATETDFGIPLHGDIPIVPLHNRRVSNPALVPLHSLHENAEIEDGNSGVAIRTIHELRQAGAESRFKDEVEDLLDRVGSPAMENTTRRSGLLEMAERMRDKLFYTKFISHGMDQRLFLHLGQEQDVISGFIFVSILIPILEAGITSMMVTQLRRQGITRLLIRLMKIDDSIIAISKSRKVNMSKVAQLTIIEQHKAFLQLRVWGDLRPQAISPRTASLQCLELMIRQSREAGDTGDIISKELVSNLFTILRDSHKNEATTDASVNFQLALSTLVSHSLNPMVGIEEFLPIIRNILEVSMQKAPEDSNVTLLLRLALNTTNNSPAASDALASPDLLQLMSRAVIERFTVLSGSVIEEKRLVLVDNLVLILVVMINIVELSTRARRCFLAIQDNSLANLIKIFQDNIERAFEADSVEDSHLNVAGGYLAVLLGCLSLSPEISDQIRRQQRTASLQPLIICIDEFISHHKKVDALLKDEVEHQTQVGLTNRLQTLVDKLNATNVLQ